MQEIHVLQIWAFGQPIQTKTPTCMLSITNSIKYIILYIIKSSSLYLSLLIRIHFRQKSMRLCIFNHNNIILSKYQPIEIIISCNVHSTLKTNFTNYRWKISERKCNFLNSKVIKNVIQCTCMKLQMAWEVINF